VLAALAENAGCEIAHMEVVPDDFSLIEDRLNHFVDDRCDLVFTTGGTGMTPDDITPEATRVVIHREAPGLAEAMRAEGARHTPLGILTRGISGIRGRTLIVNFPGSPRAVRQSWPVVEPTLKHAADTLERS
jgi:molybdenum cofactor synthesis domain-containing protein